MMDSDRELRREHRRRRFRRRRRRAYIRSVYFLPSMATLGNAICGFGAMYIAGLNSSTLGSPDNWTRYFADHPFTVAAYLVFLAMLFDALDGRLARFTRHTTDFGGQLDSLADVISFGCAPAFIALQLVRAHLAVHCPDFPVTLSRLIWAIGALYMSCAAMRLARFNVSNEHGEQHHFSFLGLPSPGAGGTVAAFILMQQDLAREAAAHPSYRVIEYAASACVWVLPLLVLLTGLLMVSAVRYPHFVNRYLRGKRSMGRLLLFLVIGLLVIVAHRYVLAVGTLAYVVWGLTSSTLVRRRSLPPAAPPAGGHPSP